MVDDQLVFCEMFEGQVYGPREGPVPRNWQVECTEQYSGGVLGAVAGAPYVFCVYGGTGSGKTKVAGLMASTLLNRRLAQQVVVVCPSRQIKKQIRRDFLRYFGIDLEFFNKGRHQNGIPRMKQGYVLTYSALMNDPTLHRRLCQAEPTMIIFDEIHHLGDDNAWGDGATEAFGKVAYIVGLTGTPYRLPHSRIPFIAYEDTEVNGIIRLRPDYSYSLGCAVADGVCRKPVFFYHGGKTRVRVAPHSGEVIVDFADHNVTETMAALRLRGAVTSGSSDRRAMLAASLARCRAEGRKVIIFLGGDTEGDSTPTQDATTLLPDELRDLGYGLDEYEVVTGDDEDAHRKIDSFGAHPTKWILISINMVSEGTDIPEISAAIFLTSITAKQTTIQRIGRTLRLRSETDPHQDADIFFFDDEHLRAIAEEIDSEVQAEVDLRKKTREPGAGEGEKERRFRAEAIGIGDGALRTVKFHGHEWSADLFERARAAVQARGLPPTMLRTVLELMHSEFAGQDNGRS